MARTLDPDEVELAVYRPGRHRVGRCAGYLGALGIGVNWLQTPEALVTIRIDDMFD